MVHDEQEIRAELCKQESMDPRIRRSRQMLHDALSQLLEQKDFDRISIQEIAELSTLNRATFYSHYPDKFALLQCMIGNRFHELMARRNVRFECNGALRAISLGVCDFLLEMPGANRRGKGQVESSIQMSIVAVVKAILLDGLRKHATDGSVSPELLASVVAWAIYGAAYTWVENANRCSAEHMAEAIEQLVSPMMQAGSTSLQSAL